MVHPLEVTDLHKTEAGSLNQLWRYHSDKNNPLQTSPTYGFPAHDVTEVDHHIHVWGPGVELPLPGGERGQRHHQ